MALVLWFSQNLVVLGISCYFQIFSRQWYYLVFYGTFRFWYWYFLVLSCENYTLAKKKKWNYLLLFRTSKLLNWDFVEIIRPFVNTELRLSGIIWYFNK